MVEHSQTPADPRDLQSQQSTARIAPTRYDELSCELILVLDGGLLATTWNWDRNEQRIADAVCRQAPMSLARWDSLGRSEREYWLEVTIERLRTTKKSVNLGPRHNDPPTGADGESGPIPVWLGDGKVSVDKQTLSLEPQLSDVLQALVELQAAKSPELIKHSGVSDAVAVLKRIRKKFPQLAPFITCPGGRGKGGYRTTIRPKQ